MDNILGVPMPMTTYLNPPQVPVFHENRGSSTSGPPDNPHTLKALLESHLGPYEGMITTSSKNQNIPVLEWKDSRPPYHIAGKGMVLGRVSGPGGRYAVPATLWLSGRLAGRRTTTPPLLPAKLFSCLCTQSEARTTANGN